jgi:hypothetical protein
MSAFQRLASVSLAAAIVLVVAACGHSPGPTSAPATAPTAAAPKPSSSPTTAATTAPAPEPSSSPTTAATTAPAPEPPSSPASQGNSAYPYRPGGVTYYGEEGAVELFSIPAGTYTLNQQASYDPANDPDGTGMCLFGGELDYQSGSGGTIPLGDNSVPITAQVPINGPPSTAPYPAGNYRLYIYPSTTCSWQIELWPDN